MTRSVLAILASCFVSHLFLDSARGQVEYVKENGVTYERTERVEQVPVTRSEWVERQQTVLQDQYVTRMQDRYRTVYTPITQYQPEPRWHGLLNPFSRPYVAIHMRPRTHWETRHERFQTPVTYRETVPVTQTVRRLERTPGFVEEKVVRMVPVYPQRSESRVATRPIIQSTSPSTAFRSRQLANDPPAQGRSLTR